MNQAQAMRTAMLCATAITAQFVAGKATRDALFLTSLSVTALPTMLMATSALSILLVAAHARWSQRVVPSTLVPVFFLGSGALFVVEWFFRSSSPVLVAIVIYLHISGVGPMLSSAFWLIVNERFDPRTAKRRLGQITGAGTLGGLIGALVAERVASAWGAPATLLFLAAVQMVAAVLARSLAQSLASSSGPAAPTAALPAAPAAIAPRTGLRVIANAPHLQHVVALVLLGTISAGLLDYVFKARAVETFGPGDGLLRFFALYYAITSVLSFALQTLASRPVLERFGLALTTSTPSIALLAGSLSSLLLPGFGGMLVARAGQSIFQASWFRAGYELFFAPVAPAERRAAKAVIDVAFDRLGDAASGGLIRMAIVFLPAFHSVAIVGLAMASAIGAIVAASHLNRWYLRTLEKSLLDRSGGVDVLEGTDQLTARIVVAVRSRNAGVRPAQPSRDPLGRDIDLLRSGRQDAIMDRLSRSEAVAGPLVAHVIALLDREPVADYAMFALRKVAEERIGELTDALLDPNQSVQVRSRIARVLAIGVSQRAVDALLLGLDDGCFEVRFQAARSLAAVVNRNSLVRVDRDRIYEVVSREVTVGDPAGQNLGHVFTLLSLVLPREPLQIAFRSLQSDDRQLRGTALEYLEQILPVEIRVSLWPSLAVRRRPAAELQPA